MNDGLKILARNLETSLLHKKRKKDILITVRNEIMFNNIRLIYKKLRADSRVRIWICLTFRKRFLDDNLKQMKQTCSGAYFISYRLAEYVKWDLILCPEHTLYFRRDCPMIYTGHSLKSGKLNPAGASMKYGPPSRHADGGVIYTKIFCANQHEQQTVREHFPDHAPRVRVVGNTLVDELMATKSLQQEILTRLELDPERKTLLVTSTWRKESFAQSQGLEFLRKLDPLLEHYNVIISFHQNNFVREYSPDIDWRTELNKYHKPNLYILKDNESTLGFLAAADILLTDHTSTSLYYLFLQRPIIYYVHPEVRYDKGALILELQKMAHAVDHVRDLPAEIATAMKTFDAQEYEQFTHKVCNHVGHSWERMELEIYETLNLPPMSAITNSKKNEVLV